MAFSASVLGTASYVSTGAKSIGFSAPTSGDLLFLIISATDASCVWSSITSGWDQREISPVSTGDVRGILLTKVSNGTETSVGWSVSTTIGQALAGKISGWTSTATFDDSDANTSNLTTGSTSISSGTAVSSSSSGVAIAVFASDRWDTMETSRSYSNSFTEIGVVTTSGSRSGAWAAWKEVTGTGNYTTTFSCVDTGDQAWGAIVIFKDGTGGGGGGFQVAWVKHSNGLILPGNYIK